jgi:hypothetical protein
LGKTTVGAKIQATAITIARSKFPIAATPTGYGAAIISTI